MDVKFVEISPPIIEALKKAVEAEIAYQTITECGRKFGITGEVGEILACQLLGLRLVKDPRSVGYDALDSEDNRVQIKTRRSESGELPKKSGRLGRFSGHPFDYALMVILNRNYKVFEVWRVDHEKLRPVIESHKRRNPTIKGFEDIGEKVYPR